MTAMSWILGVQALLFLTATICWFMIVVRAFRTEPIQGLLCLLMPYMVLWAFKNYNAPNRRVVLGILLVAPALAITLSVVSATMAMNAHQTRGELAPAHR